MMRRLLRSLRGKIRNMGTTHAELPSDPVQRARVLQQFAGLWIAIEDDVVIAAEKTIDDLYRKLDDLEKPMATVKRVPDPNQGVFVA